jgi:hypothetical protein
MFTAMSLSAIFLSLVAASSALTIPSSGSLTSRSAPECDFYTTYEAPAGKARFERPAVPISGSGNVSLGGTWVRTVHDGAASAATLLSNNQSEAQIWQFDPKHGDIFYAPAPGHYENSFRLYSGRDDGAFGGIRSSDAPLGDMAVGTFIGIGNQNFTFDTTTSRVQPPCGTFAACWLNTTTPFSLAGAQLVWHSKGMASDANCVDVELKAIDRF